MKKCITTSPYNLIWNISEPNSIAKPEANAMECLDRSFTIKDFTSEPKLKG